MEALVATVAKEHVFCIGTACADVTRGVGIVRVCHAVFEVQYEVNGHSRGGDGGICLEVEGEPSDFVGSRSAMKPRGYNVVDDDRPAVNCRSERLWKRGDIGAQAVKMDPLFTAAAVFDCSVVGLMEFGDDEWLGAPVVL